MAKWSDNEDAVLALWWDERGNKWPGWEDVLPGRSADARKHRARKLGLGCERNDTLADTRKVMRLLRSGVPPSEIDRRLGMEEGTAKRVIVGRWTLL